MLRQMPREPRQRIGQGDQLADRGRLRIETRFAQPYRSFIRPIPPHKTAGDAIQLRGIQPERLADIAEGAARTISNHGRGQRGAIPAIFPVDVLDHLFTALVLEIHIDVRRLVPFFRDEALE